MVDRSLGDILIVDDSPANLGLLSGILGEAGYRVRTATGGNRALQIARSRPPELILLDINMPDLDGYRVCEALKADAATRPLPVIFLSANDDPVDKVRAFGAGGVDYVTKPFHAGEVLARVGTQLSVSRLQRETEAKRQELDEAYEAIRRAQAQIERLQAPSAALLERTDLWAELMAGEIAKSLGVKRLGVWALEEARFVPLAAVVTADAAGSLPSGAANAQPEPDWTLLLRGGVPAEVDAGADTRLVPILGATGVLCGAVVMEGKLLWTDAERQVIRTFASHLGTALELRRFRQAATEAEARRAATREELRRRGLAPVEVCPECGLCTAAGSPGEDLAGAPDEPPRCAEDGALLDLSLLLPQLVQGRYRLTRLLGEGGMGTVFSAHDERLGRDVAVKVLRSAALQDSAMRFRFEREAHAAARIRHPGVVALFDSGELEDGSAFLVMELLSGLDLDILFRFHGRGRPQQVARLVRQLGGALAAAHAAGVIHRDVKPANVLLVADGSSFQAKLVDFGIARSTRGDDRVTQTGVVLGTPAYMSPEQVRGHDVDERGDLYSFAAVAYQALVDKKPIVSEGAVNQVLFDVVMVEPAPPSKHLRGLPPEVDAIFASALVKRREDRPADALAWAEACAALLEGLPPELSEIEGWPPIAVVRRGRMQRPSSSAWTAAGPTVTK